MQTIEMAEKKYGKHRMSVDSKLFTGNNLGKAKAESKKISGALASKETLAEQDKDSDD